jgi:hypothetical protein
VNFEGKKKKERKAYTFSFYTQTGSRMEIPKGLMNVIRR